MMHGVTIRDSSPDGRFLAVDLIDILRVLGTAAHNSDWLISNVECVGEAAAEELHRLADASARIPGRTLVALAADVTQVIEGVFAGYRSDEEHPWIVICAVDSTAFDVRSAEADVLECIRQRFRQVAELPAVG
jgi:hypothetical protein